VDVDLSVLRTAEATGFARQHGAVGDIRYPAGDRGVIVIVKPTLIGDEPVDVQQYRGRNPQFPHDSTGEQFYDEKLWESYTRLREHVARSVSLSAQLRAVGADRHSLFGEVRNEWYPAPPSLRDAIASSLEDVRDIEAKLGALNDPAVVAEVYPES